MPVKTFVDEPEPSNPNVQIWRYIEFWKLKDLVRTKQLYFRRADKLDDPNEGLPPSEYERVLNLNKYDIKDIRKRDHHIGFLAQARQSCYVNCWHLQELETAKMWRQYGKDGVAIVSRYDILKKVLHPLSDEVFVGLIRYGSKHLTGWNVIRFMTTKREEYSSEKEVRAMIWVKNSGDKQNRHFDANNLPLDRPIYEPPSTLPEAIRKNIDVNLLINDIIVSPFAEPSRLNEVRSLFNDKGVVVNVYESSLTRHSSLIPSNEELKRYIT